MFTDYSVEWIHIYNGIKSDAKLGIISLVWVRLCTLSLSLSLIVLRLEINWYLVCNKCCKYLALNRYTQSRVHDTSYLIPVPHCASYSSTPLNGRFLLKDVPGCCISRSGRRNLRSMIRMCRLHRPGLYGEYFWIRVLYVKFHSNI